MIKYPNKEDISISIKRDMLEFAGQNAPCYIYEKSLITERCRALKAAIPEARFLYSVKTNPFAPVLKAVSSEGFGADAASSEEVFKAVDAGILPESIYYSAPGKTREDIRKALGKCVFIADSLSELEMLNEYAKERGETLSAGLRINPLFSMDGTDPSSSKFGIDEELISPDVFDFPCLKISGIHVHLKSQVLNADTLCAYYENCYDLAERVSHLLNTDLKFINFGSGIGTVYDGDIESPLDLEKIGHTFKKLAERNRRSLSSEFLLETGRFVTCNAGTYFTRIIDRKVSRGRTYLIVENTVNGFLRPAIAELLRQCLGSFPSGGLEPFYTSAAQCTFTIPGKTGQTEKVDIAGNLCTPLDVMARDIELPRGEAGDIIAVSNAGSYGYTLSPLLFSSHGAPKEFMWE